MAALITAAQAQALLPGLSLAEASALPALIGPATAAVETVCRTPLALASYDELHRPDSTRRIELRRRPVVPYTVELRADLETILEVLCDDPAAQRATVTLTPMCLILSRAPAAMGDPGPLPLAQFATVGQLAAAINATSAWSATVQSGREAWLATDLNPNPGPMGAKSRPACLTAYTRTLSDWAMDDPGNGVVELTEDLPQAFRFPDRSYAGYGYGYGTGALGGSNPRAADVRALYQAGFDPTGMAGPITPDDLQLCVALTVKAAIECGQFSGIITEASLGNTDVKVGDPMIVPRAAARGLARYIRRGFA